MNKKIVISFPGGRGAEIPLLYFCAKKYEDMGYEKVFVNHPLEWDESMEVLFENTDRVIKTINFSEYDEIIFVAKSIGTLVACKIKEKYNVPAKMILLTPLEGTLPYIRDNLELYRLLLDLSAQALDMQAEITYALSRISSEIMSRRRKVLYDIKRDTWI